MEYNNQDLQDMLCTGLRLTLEYLCVHASLRELFTIQELLSRHAADVACRHSQQARGPFPKDDQEMPAVLREQLVEMERQQHALKEQYAQGVMQGSRNVAQP